MKRFAYSLIIVSLLGPFLIALLPESLWTETLTLRDSDGPYTDVKVKDGLLTGVFIALFIPLPVAGWILAGGTSNPKEGWGHRLIMAFATLMFGFPASFACWAGAAHLRDWLCGSRFAQAAEHRFP